MGIQSRRAVTSMHSILALTCLTIAAAAPGHHHQMGRGGHTRLAVAPAAPTKNIAELAIATPQLSTLLAAVKAAGLSTLLPATDPSQCLRQPTMPLPRFPRTP